MHQSKMLKMVSRRAVLLTALFGGFCGAHKFMLGAKREGYLYLALSFTLISSFATIFDIAYLSFAPHINGKFAVRSWDDRDTIERSTIIRLGLGLVIVIYWIICGLSIYN